MQSKAATVEEYLAELPADRREAIKAIRKVILKNLDREYEEGMQYGMISYYVPHRVYPPGYHCDPKQPLPFTALASQKNYISIYLMCVYDQGEQLKWFLDAWSKSGKKIPDMGKSCVRFKRLDDIALDVIGEAIRRVPARQYIEYYESVMKHARTRRSKEAKTAAARKPAKAVSPKRATANKGTLKAARPALKKAAKKK
jgi:hypothetical protein